MDEETIATRVRQAFSNWLQELPPHHGSLPARGTIAAALIVLDRLKTNFDLNISAHTAPGGTQIQGTGGDAVRRVLAIFGETRIFLREGGRTNRGLRAEIEGLLAALRQGGLAEAHPVEREKLLVSLQEILVGNVREYFNQKKIRFTFDQSKSTRQAVGDLLALARADGKDGPLAQHLVGAKLALRFPDMQISNYSYSTADVQSGRSGDFALGNAVFHVTVAPASALYHKCKDNVREGLRPYILVPERVLDATRQNVELPEWQMQGRVAVEAIESFIAQNLDELSRFGDYQRVVKLHQCLTMYNARVDEAETDRSLQIEIPSNLVLPPAQ